MSNLTTAIQLTKQSTYRLNNGLQIPVIAYGCYEVPKEEAAQHTYEALSIGYRHLDSAAAYNNEKEVATGIAKFLKENPQIKREDIWFTTKIRYNDEGYDETKRAVESCAEKVKDLIGYVDLVLLHAPITSRERRLGSWKALQEYVLDPSNGTLNIKSIGVSNYGIAHIKELFEWEGFLVKPVVDQLELHPWLPHCELRQFCIENGILLEAYSPLTRGIMFDDPVLSSLLKKFNTNPATILLKWSFLQGFIVLVKSTHPARMKSNLNVLPDGKSDELDQTSHLGVIDLETEIVEKLDMPESHKVLCWNGNDPTLYKDPN